MTRLLNTGYGDGEDLDKNLISLIYQKKKFNYNSILLIYSIQSIDSITLIYS